MTREQAQTFLRALVSDANDALAHIADDRYDLAVESMACAGPDVMNVIEGLRQLDAENPRKGCCNDVCADCQPLDTAEYA